MNKPEGVPTLKAGVAHRKKRQNSHDKRNTHNYLLALLQEGKEKYRFRPHTYCLMTNHLHQVLQVGDIPLSRIMQNVSFRNTSSTNRQIRGWASFPGALQGALIDAVPYRDFIHG